MPDFIPSTSWRSPPLIDLGPIIGGLPAALVGPTMTMRGTKELQAKLNQYAKGFGSPQRFCMAAAHGYRAYMVGNYLSGQKLRRRSGELARAWQPRKVGRDAAKLSPGRLPYSRVHEFGLNYPFQPVRGYTTKSGKKVKLYLRDMKIKATHYVTETIQNADDEVGKRLEKVAQNIMSEFGDQNTETWD